MRATDASSRGATDVGAACAPRLAARSLLLFASSMAAHRAMGRGESPGEKRAGQLGASDSVTSTAWTEWMGREGRPAHESQAVEAALEVSVLAKRQDKPTRWTRNVVRARGGGRSEQRDECWLVVRASEKGWVDGMNRR